MVVAFLAAAKKAVDLKGSAEPIVFILEMFFDEHAAECWAVEAYTVFKPIRLGEVFERDDGGDAVLLVGKVLIVDADGKLGIGVAGLVE